MERELTRDEKLFFMTRALVENRRRNLVEEVRDFINAEFRADDPEGMAIELDDFLEELLRGTGWTLDGQGVSRT
jgi:hypothetical protein